MQFDSEAGYFDHIYLGRTQEELDCIDATGLAAESRAELTSAEQEQLWKELTTSQEAPVRYRAFWALAAAPEAVPLLAGLLRKQDERVDLASVKKWLRELDDDAFDVREKATENLAKIVESIAGLLEEEATRTESVEVKFRIAKLLRDRPVEDGRAGIIIPAMRILDLGGSPAAKKLLEEFAEGPADSKLAQEARKQLGKN